MPKLSPTEALEEIKPLLNREPVFGAGSLFSAIKYDLPDGWADLDVFVPTPQVLMTTGQILLSNGYTMDDRFSRVWERWKLKGFKGWHTNSLKLHSREDVETNIIYKTEDGKPPTSLYQVIEGFDFGHLDVGYDFATARMRDYCRVLHPDQPAGDEDYPLNPAKRSTWVPGYISQYHGIREPARWAKFAARGYPMDRARDDLVLGLRMVALYHTTSANGKKRRVSEQKELLAQIYRTIADKLADNALEEILRDYEEIDYDDPLDEILETLQ